MERQAERETPDRLVNAEDQARSAIFRTLLLVQVVVAGGLGLVSFALPEAFASLIGVQGASEAFLYRIAGAATLGYAMTALIGLFRPSWRELRIPVVAAFVFNLAAAAGALLSLDQGDRRPIVLAIVLAASIFTVVTAYWLYRDEGPEDGDEERLESGFRAVLLLATATAIIFGITPLLTTDLFAGTFGIGRDDPLILRMGGAATLGFGVAGILQVLDGRWRRIRVQVVGAIVFNALAAVSAAIYLASGGQSLLGWAVLVAAGFFTFALTVSASRAQR